jgi:hypothetical protein
MLNILAVHRRLRSETGSLIKILLACLTARPERREAEGVQLLTGRDTSRPLTAGWTDSSDLLDQDCSIQGQRQYHDKDTIQCSQTKGTHHDHSGLRDSWVEERHDTEQCQEKGRVKANLGQVLCEQQIAWQKQRLVTVVETKPLDSRREKSEAWKGSQAGNHTKTAVGKRSPTLLIEVSQAVERCRQAGPPMSRMPTKRADPALPAAGWLGLLM